MTQDIQIPVFWAQPKAISPYPGLEALLLKPLRGSGDQLNAAETVLSLHHEYLRGHTAGLPAGRAEQEMWDFYKNSVAKMRLDALYVSLCDLPSGGEILLSFYSDHTALIWLKRPEGDYAPVPVTFELKLPSALNTISILPFQEPSKPAYRLDPSEKALLYIVDEDAPNPLKAFLERHWWLDVHLNNQTWSGDHCLLSALLHEAKAWVNAMPEMKPVCLAGKTPARDGSEVVPPWVWDIAIGTKEEVAQINIFARDVLNAIRYYHKDVLAHEESIWVSINGRQIHPEGRLDGPFVFISFDAKGQPTTNMKLRGFWSTLIEDCLDSDSFPVPPALQVLHGSQVRDTATKGSEMRVIASRTIGQADSATHAEASSHERMESLLRLRRYMGDPQWAKKIPG